MSRWLVATMTVALFIALVVAVSGFESLLSGQDPIRQADATPYLGPSMVVGAAVVVFFATAVGARKGNVAVTGLLAAAGSYLVLLAIGSLGYTIITADVAQLVVFPAGYALAPFVVGTTIVGFVAVVCGVLLVRQQHRAGGATHGGPHGGDMPHGGVAGPH
jgi:hypothetical protein